MVHLAAIKEETVTAMDLLAAIKEETTSAVEMTDLLEILDQASAVTTTPRLTAMAQEETTIHMAAQETLDQTTMAALA